jgi:hypothetical protein
MDRYSFPRREVGAHGVRRVRPEVATPRPLPGQAGFPDERQFVNAPVPESEPVPAPSLFFMTKAALVDLAIARGIDATGTRAEILGRLSHG